MEQVFIRSKDIMQPLINFKLLIFGLGSVGSAVVEMLVRNNIRNISLVDYDIVEDNNIGRTTYVLTDIGKYKVDALSEKLRNINRLINIKCYYDNICNNPRKFESIISENDLIVES